MDRNNMTRSEIVEEYETAILDLQDLEIKNTNMVVREVLTDAMLDLQHKVEALIIEGSTEVVNKNLYVIYTTCQECDVDSRFNEHMFESKGPSQFSVGYKIGTHDKYNECHKCHKFDTKVVTLVKFIEGSRN